MNRWLKWITVPLMTLMVFISYLMNARQSSQAQDASSELPLLAVAPELHQGIWLNTEVPLTLETLRGKVVLLEMWTFDCINCIRTIPYVREWYETYKDEGFVVVGNHYPEFNYERDLDNLRNALTRLEIEYPVLQDNDRQTWTKYNNRYWPTMYLIDKQGNIRYTHIGEGRYEQTEKAIQALLAEDYTSDESPLPKSPLIRGVSATEVLNVRAGAGVNFEQIGTILPNEAYYILDEVNGWYQILFDGATAYVSGEYVTLHEIYEPQPEQHSEES